LRFYAGPKAIQTVSTAVIGLIGSAPTHLVAEAGDRPPINTPILITSVEEAAKAFGPDTPGFNIPSAIRAVFEQGAGTLQVVNVFDPDKHADGGAPDPSKITAEDLLAGTDAAGRRTGLAAFLDAKAKFGFGPKQLIVPGYAGLNGVLQGLDTVAKKLRAFAWVDAPAGLAPDEAIQARGTGGALNISSKEIGLCYPMVKTTDSKGNPVTMGISPFIAGAQAQKDLTVGFHHSASNTKLQGVTGLERPIYADIMDPACEANLLNGAGFITIFNSFGTGYRTWGNRSAAFPGNSDPDNFICVHRTATIIEDSICAFSMGYIDQPITNGLIDQLLQDVNAYLNMLFGLGAVSEGAVAWFDEAKNPPQLRADGKLRICYRFLPPAPLENLIYESYIDVSLAVKGV
jgi:phage tail sheath protein FI